jgi:SAM-dependent methyltransferase
VTEPAPPNLLAGRPALAERILERKHASLVATAARRRPRSMLEIGPGEGFVARAAAAAGIERYVAVDGSAAIVEHLRAQGFDGRLATVPPLPADLDPVDLVYCSHVVEHLPGPDAVEALLASLHAVLNPGGAVAVVFPDVRSMGARFWDDDATHQWPSTPRRVLQVAQAAGWRPELVEERFLHLRGLGAAAGRLFYRLYPTRALMAVDRRRADLWLRGRLLFVPDAIVVLVPA